jgi:hypothetical protein
MKKFICLICNAEWYSASQIDSPCEICGGLIVEASPKEQSSNSEDNTTLN